MLMQSIMPLAICMQDRNGSSMMHVHTMRLHAARDLALAFMHITP